MRMKKLLGFSLVAGLLLLAVISASADNTAHLYFNGPQGGSLGGIQTYPYGFTINGDNNGGNYYPLICDTFTRGISPGDQWDAYVLNMGNLNSTNVGGLFFGGVNGGGSGAVQYYMAAALLFEDARNNSGNAPYDNWAIWYMFSPSDVTGSSQWGSLSSADQNTIKGDASAAISAAASDQPSQFSNVVIYTPTDGVGQEFFGWNTPGAAPEPSSLALFGSGVLGIAAVLRRKLKA